MKVSFHYFWSKFRDELDLPSKSSRSSPEMTLANLGPVTSQGEEDTGCPAGSGAQVGNQRRFPDGGALKKGKIPFSYILCYSFLE